MEEEILSWDLCRLSHNSLILCKENDTGHKLHQTIWTCGRCSLFSYYGGLRIEKPWIVCPADVSEGSTWALCIHNRTSLFTTTNKPKARGDVRN